MNMRLAVPIVVGLGAGLWFYVKPTYLGEAPVAPPTPAEVAAAAKPSYLVGAHEPVVVNLADVDGPHYARLQIALEFDDQEQAYVGLDDEAVKLRDEELHEELDQRLYLIMDALIAVFSQRSAAEVLAVEARASLKDEVTSAINSNLGGPMVAGVSFVSLVVQ